MIIIKAQLDSPKNPPPSRTSMALTLEDVMLEPAEGWFMYIDTPQPYVASLKSQPDEHPISNIEIEVEVEIEIGRDRRLILAI